MNSPFSGNVCQVCSRRKIREGSFLDQFNSLKAWIVSSIEWNSFAIEAGILAICIALSKSELKLPRWMLVSL